MLSPFYIPFLRRRYGLSYNISMKRIVSLVAVLSIGVCVFCVTRNVQEGHFSLSGTVTVPDRLVEMAQADNNSCAIIVKNEADVPVAIKRIVNPKFPLAFQMGEEDLLAEQVDGVLKLEVQINNHGQLGIVKKGDIFGTVEGPLHATDKNVVIRADKTLGPVQLARNVKGNFFRTAAR